MCLVFFPGIFYNSSISLIRHPPGPGRYELSSFYCISSIHFDCDHSLVTF
jgi:hypothetical protein